MIYLIIGMVLTAIGIVFTVFGTIKQEEDAQKFQAQVIKSQDKSIELSEKLAKINEERFYRLTRPEMNILRVEEIGHGIQSKFKIIAKNTGNNDCLNSKLIIDRHNSPLVGKAEIKSFAKVPKDSIVEYTIPIFQSDLAARVQDETIITEFNNVFLKRFNNSESAIIVFFHFEYIWNDDTLKSSQYSIIKSNNQQIYASSSQTYVESD